MTYMPPWVESLRNWKHKIPCKIEGFCAFCALQEHVELSLSSMGEIIAPWDLVNNLSNKSISFQRWEQEDAHEYIHGLLEGLHNCALCPVGDCFSSCHTAPKIPFEIMFLLNALVHKGIANYHRITPEFYNLLDLVVTPTKLSTLALRHMLAYTYPVFDALGRFKTALNWISQNPKLPKSPKIVEETIEVRRFVITPTKAYCLSPEVELSNNNNTNNKGTPLNLLVPTVSEELRSYVIFMLDDNDEHIYSFLHSHL